MVINILYQTVTFFLSLITLPVFYIFPRGRFQLQQRYGFWFDPLSPLPSEDKIIWLHAASYGEVNAVIPVVNLLKEKFKNHKILITSTSDTGYKKAAEIADYSRISPFDNYLYYKKAFSKFKPAVLIVTETEIWPGMIFFAQKEGIPAFLINARISDYSIKNYRLFKILIAPLLNYFTKIAAINQESKDRLRILGAKENIIHIAGYSKYDIEPAVSSDKEAAELKKNYFTASDPVITLGSIRPGEEDIWFTALCNARKENLNFNLIVAPRHLDKVLYFEEKLKDYGIEFARYSDLKQPSAKTIILDVMGRLNYVYSFSALSFIGASLVNIGGHNPLEPACYQSVICIGPNYNNVREIIEKLQSEKAVNIINDVESACRLIKSVCKNDAEVMAGAQRAHAFWKNNYGSSRNIIQLLDFSR